MFLDFEGDRLSSHLQEMDGLTQRLSFQTDSIDGQDSIPNVDGPSPAGSEEQRTQRHQIRPVSTDRRAGKPVRLPVHWLRWKQRRFLSQKKMRQPLFMVWFIWEKNAFTQGSADSATLSLMSVSLSSQITILTSASHSTPLTSAVVSPLCQAFPGEARDHNGVKGLLRARNCDTQRSVISLQLNCVDYRAWHLQLIYNTHRHEVKDKGYHQCCSIREKVASADLVLL